MAIQTDLWRRLIFRKYKNEKPIPKLIVAHKTFNTGEDKPLPGGFAKGVGKGFPVMPWMKCGRMLHKKIPAKNAAR